MGIVCLDSPYFAVGENLSGRDICQLSDDLYQIRYVSWKGNYFLIFKPHFDFTRWNILYQIFVNIMKKNFNIILTGERGKKIVSKPM